MNLNLKGKIGRLPETLREEVNVRLRKGETGRVLAGWLNGLPEVQALLAAEFGGKPVREQNVSEWRLGGYQHWLQLQEAREMMGQFHADGHQFNEVAGGSVTETLATWLAARYVVGMKKQMERDGDSPAAWERMREFCQDVVALRRGEYRAQRLEFERVRAGLAGGDARVGASRRGHRE